MNPLTNVRNVTKLNEQDLQNGRFDHKLTWHDQYCDSAYVFIGGLPYDLTEGDILCVFSQYGEIVNINLVRDKKTGKSKGFAFLCYEDQRSTILCVDNFNGIKLGGRTIRVDHVSEYRVPKSDEKDEDGKLKDKIEQGCAPSPEVSEDESLQLDTNVKKKKKKKEKSKKKKKKRNHQNSDSDSDIHSHKNTTHSSLSSSDNKISVHGDRNLSRDESTKRQEKYSRDGSRSPHRKRRIRSRSRSRSVERKYRR